jgi:hypothetical protein
MNKQIRWPAAGWLLLGCALAQAQQHVGQAEFVHGVTVAQQPGQSPRFLAKGDALVQGDVINTGSRGFAVLGLKDGTRMTLRPNTSFAVEKFAHGAGEEGLAMRLFRGGMRAISGLIGKRNPAGSQLATPTATIGIRGTEFDARICTDDCQREAQTTRGQKPVRAPDPTVARVALIQGAATAAGADGVPRILTSGAPLYNGESVRTGRNAYAVLAFRDRSKVTLTSDTNLKLENVRFEARQPDQGSFVVRLLGGGIRALTGLLGKRDPRAVRFNTAVATIGIRGTGVDIYERQHCFEVPDSAPTPGGGPKQPAGKGKQAEPAPPPVKAARQECADNAVYASTWDGASVIEAAGKEQAVEKDKTGVFNPKRGAPELLAALPDFIRDETAPRPDKVEADFDGMFDVKTVEDYVPGTYVGTRSGHTQLCGSAGCVDLGSWETGQLADGSDKPARIGPNPGFLYNDPYPTPDEADERTLRLIELVSPGGEPGTGICTP